MNILAELKPFEAQMSNFAVWYNNKADFNRPISLKEIFKYDFEVTIGLLLNWLYKEHDIVINVTETYYGIFHSKDATLVNIESKYKNGRISLYEATVNKQDLFENYKIAIVIAVSMLTNYKTPF